MNLLQKPKTVYLRAFNTHFFEFLETSILFIPENDNIIGYKTSVQFIKNANPTTIIKAWYLHIVEPYSAQINEGKYDFFLEKDYSNDLLYTGSTKVGVLKIIDEIRTSIKLLDKEQIDKLLTYIQNLSRLSDEYHKQF